MNFNVGDVVRLKSGGPKMTVERIGEELLGCIWLGHEAADSPNRFTFVGLLLETLEPVTDTNEI